MSWLIPQNNGTCPCKACQAHQLFTPRQREKRKRIKLIDKFTEQMARQK